MRRIRRGWSRTCRRGAALSLAVALLGTGACAVTTSTAPATDAAPRPHLTAAWSRDDLDVLAQPTAAGETAVVLHLRDGATVLSGIDTADGTTLWDRETHFSLVPTGWHHGPTVVDGRVVYLRHVGPGKEVVVVVADGATGDDLHVSVPLWVTTPPLPCGADGTEACFEGHRTVLDEAAKGHRLDVRSGTVTSGTHPTPSASATTPTALAVLPDPGLGSAAPGDRPQSLVRTAPDGRGWQRPTEAVMGRPVDPWCGWWFAHDPTSDLFVGEIDGRLRPELGSDLVPPSMVALDAATGEERWRAPGTTQACLTHGLAFRDPTGDLRPVRCRYGEPAAGWEATEEVAITLEGFDRATGEPTWSRDVGLWGDDQPLSEGGRGPGWGVGDEILLPGPGGPLVLDLVTGATRSPDEHAVRWCERPRTFTVAGDRAEEREGGWLVAPCDGDDLTSVLPDELHPDLLRGPPIGDTAVVGTTGGLVAYRVSGA